MVTYGYESIDDGSDMDVSSGDEGPVISPNVKQPHEGLVRDLQFHIQKQESLAQPVQPQVVSFISNSSNCTTPNNSYASVASTAATATAAVADNNVILIDSDSDNESESSFHTAPNSPMSIDQEPGETDEIEELQKEHDDLVKQIEEKEADIKRINEYLKEKKELREALRIKVLRYEVSNSIKRNRQSTVTSTSSPIMSPAKKAKQAMSVEKSNKGKERITEERKEHNVYEDEAYEAEEEGEIVENTSSRNKRVRIDKELAELQDRTFEELGDIVDQLPSNTKQPVTLEDFRNILYSNYIAAMEKRLTSNNPESISFPDIVSLSQDYLRKIVTQSHVIGYTNLGQLKIQLLDLKQHAEKNTLNPYQKANVLELIRRLRRNKGKPDTYIPTAPDTKKDKPKTTYRLLLGPQFYGNPRLRYDEFKSYTDDIVDRAIFYFIPVNEKLNAALKPGKKKIPSIIREALHKPGPHQESAADLRIYLEAELNKVLNNEVKPFLAETGAWRDEHLSPQKRGEVLDKLSQVEIGRELLGLPKPDLTPQKTRIYKGSTSKTPNITNSSYSRQQNTTRNNNNASTTHTVRTTTSLARSTQSQQTSSAPTIGQRNLLTNINPRADLANLFKRSAAVEPSKSNNITHTNNTAYKPVTPSTTPTSSLNFMPYQSPLSAMGISKVPDGKPKARVPTRQLCEAESSGGVCRDKHCPHSHFSDF